MRAVTLLIIIFYSTFSKAQIPFLPDLDKADVFRETGFIGGYRFNFGFNEDFTSNNVIELGVKRAFYVDFLRSASANYYAASDFNLNWNNFFLGPKVGGYISVFGILVGSELALYSNFNEVSLRAMPYAGLGSHSFRLAFTPHIPIFNSEMGELNNFDIFLSIRLFRFNHRRYIRPEAERRLNNRLKKRRQFNPPSY
jgi:hypothetical protein